MGGSMLVELFLILFSLSVTYAQYQYGDIRLVGGSYPWEGRVEIYLFGTWGTVTDSQWSSDDAQVVCRKLGYFKPGAVPQPGAYFGEGSDPIHLDNVQCTGAEYSLIDCVNSNNTRRVSHSEDVGVQCQPADGSYQKGDIRLIGGSHNWEGRVEIYISGVWGAVGSTLWTTANAEVVCRQLGYSSSGAQALCCGNYGQSNTITHINNVMCFGWEPHITNCSHQNATEGTRTSEGAEVQCQPGMSERDGDIRLVGGSHSREGRVEVYLSETWGTISDDGPTYSAAQVACRQLGFEVYGATYHRRAYFGEGVGPIHVDNMYCSGSEYRLTDCRYDNNTSEDSHSEDWSVTCPRDGPESGDIQLDYGSSGGLYILMSGSLGTVTSSTVEWTTANTEVVCRELGYLTGISWWRSTGYGPIHLSNVSCNGSESALLDCSYNTNTTGESHSDDVAVRCQTADCISGETRLAGGQNKREGRLEICNSGRWGTVCNTQWSAHHSEVACRNLGFSDRSGFSQFDSTEFGQGTGPVLVDYINCTGSEFRLEDCNPFAHYYGCTHASDAGISCQPASCEDGQIRLVEGQTDLSGRIEVCFNKRWGTVADDSWSSSDARVSCRELGFSENYGSSYCCSQFGRGGGPIYVTDVYCSGTESRLSDCTFSNDTANNDHYEDAGVRCQPASCQDGEVRLVEGETVWEGRLEVCLGRRWGTVSSDGWSVSDAQVVCRDLGYDLSDDEIALNMSLVVSKSILLDNVDCSGEELSILDCSYDSDTSEDNHSKDVMVKCQESSCKDGDIRLSGGNEGRVEVCFSRRWGTVNGDGWSDRDSQVVCRQLGFSTKDTSFYLTNNKGDEISLPIHMDNVGCYGTEPMLINCSYHSDTSEDVHSEDVAVQCSSDGGISAAQRATIVSSVSLAVVITCICIVVVVIVVVVVIYIQKKRKSRSFDAIEPENGIQEEKDLQLKSAETKFGASNVYVGQENAPVQYDYEAVAVPTGVSYKPMPIPKPGPSSQRPSQSTETRRYTRAKPKVNTAPKPIARHNTPPEEIYEAPD